MGATFEEWRRRLLLARARWVSGSAACLVAASALASAVRDQAHASLFQRLGLSAAFALVFASTGRRSGSPGRWQPFALVLLAGGGATALTLGEGLPTLGQQGLLVLLVAACGLFFPWTFVEMAGVSLALLGLFVTPALASGEAPELGPGFWLFVCLASMANVAAPLFVTLHERQYEARESLLALDRHRADFFANVSHEIRNPLTLLLAPLETLTRSSDGLDAEARRHLELALRNGRLLAQLIDGVLDLSRLEDAKASFERRAVSLGPLLTSLCERHAGALEQKEIALGLYVARKLPPVLGDPAKLESIVSNLLSNAVKFTERKGRIEVSAVRVVVGRSSVIELSIQDDGIGIPEAHRDRVRERFARLGVGISPGSGIGLTVVDELVKWHGGSMTVEGVAPKGTRFRIRLPIARSGVPAAPRVEDRVVRRLQRAPAPRPAVRPLAPDGATPRVAALGRVLLIEDDEELRAFMAQYLGRDYQVAQASSAEEGLRLAAEFHPEVVLCDVRLPGGSGLDVARRLQEARADHRPPSVILLTAYASPDSRIEGLTSGAIDFVSKPFSPAEVAARVAVQFRLRHMTSEIVQAQKLKMLRVLLEGLSHEVRNPLSTIRYASDLLQRWSMEPSPAPGEQTLQLAGMIEESAGRIANIIRSLSVLSKSNGQGRRERWEPARAVDSTLTVLGPRCGDIEIRRAIAPDLAVRGDPAQLDQVVMNLLDNAIRAMPSGGRLEMDAGVARGELQLSVKDTGRGIAPDIASRIFDPFFTTRPIGEGMGLGLHVSKQIIEAHGGRIEVQSGAGSGTRFLVALPLETATVSPA